MRLDIHPYTLVQGDMVYTFLILGMFAAFLYYEPSGRLIGLILILSTITLCRKELSCNQEFRKEIDSQRRDKKERDDDNRPQYDDCRKSEQSQISTLIQQPQVHLSVRIYEAITSLLELPVSFIQSFITKSPSSSKKMNNRAKSLSATNLKQLQGASFKREIMLDLANILISDELLISVMSYLDRPSMGALSCTCKAMESRISQSDILWEQLWRMRYGRCWDELKHVRRRRMVGWSPSENWGPPIQGWKYFMDDFEFGWFDWILAGSNTSECCLIALGGNIYDITKFVPLHPGSPESLLMEAGGEVTQIFNDIGHSQTARRTSKEYLLSSAVAAPRYKDNYKLGQLYNKRQLELRKRAKMAKKIGKMYCAETKLNVSGEVDGGWKIVNNNDYAYDGRNDTNSEEDDSIIGINASRDDNLIRERAGGTEAESKHSDDVGKTLLCGPLHLIAKVPGHNLPCSSTDHAADVRTFYDPLAREWYVWWPCCGFGRKLEKTAMMKYLQRS